MTKEEKNVEMKESLIFIPDISGFTNFVNNTEILHARHIIAELLEIILDSNEIDLEVSEIEGDAILFYRFGEPPAISSLLAQTQKMYTGFHANLKKYETQRICQCGACSSAHHLSLKFVAHYGELVLENVKQYQKLFGRNVIIAHRLLKNNLSQKQYLLITDQLLNANDGTLDLMSKAWTTPVRGESEYDFGKCTYYYFPLDELNNLVPEPRIEDYSLPGATMKVDEFEGVINAPIKMVFDVVSDLVFRHIWMEALKDSDQLNGNITKNGSTHRCVIKDDKSDPSFYSHDFKKENDIIRFTESEHDKGISNVFTFKAIGNQVTRLSIHTFIKPNIIKQWIFKIFLQKKFNNLNNINYQNLNRYCDQLIKEGREHKAGIIL